MTTSESGLSYESANGAHAPWIAVRVRGDADSCAPDSSAGCFKCTALRSANCRFLFVWRADKSEKAQFE